MYKWEKCFCSDILDQPDEGQAAGSAEKQEESEIAMDSVIIVDESRCQTHTVYAALYFTTGTGRLWPADHSCHFLTFHHKNHICILVH